MSNNSNPRNPFMQQQGLPHGNQGHPHAPQQQQHFGLNNAEYLSAQIEALKAKLGQQEAIAGRLIGIEDTLAKLASQNSRATSYPEQFHAGVVAYPNKYPFPMVLQVELRTGDGAAYGITNDIVRAMIKVDVDNPTFLQRVTADLYKTDAVGNTGLIGVYLPLSGQNVDLFDPAGTLEYTGRDFQWAIRTSSDDRIWQSGWRSSAMLDGDRREGYILPTEYELRRNDSLVIEAQPIAPVADPAQEYVLNFYLHVYKMLQRRT